MMSSRRKKGGFTLVEIIIALMIFSIVAVVALAALVRIIDANKKAQTIQDAVVGLSFALESMSREIRTGSNVRCEPNGSGLIVPNSDGTINAQACASVGQNKVIAFRSARTDDTSSPPCRLIISYLFDGSAGAYVLKKAVQPANGNGCRTTIAVADYSPIVAENVVMSGFQSSVSAGQFPLVFVNLSGKAGTSERNTTYFNVQTAASPRTP